MTNEPAAGAGEVPDSLHIGVAVKEMLTGCNGAVRSGGPCIAT
jgi:hypothetical protein